MLAEFLRLIVFFALSVAGGYGYRTYQGPPLLPLPLAVSVSALPLLLAWNSIQTIWDEQTEHLLIKKKIDTDKHRFVELARRNAELEEQVLRLTDLVKRQEEELLGIEKSEEKKRVDFEIEVNRSGDNYTVEARAPGQVSTDVERLIYTEPPDALEDVLDGYAPKSEEMKEIGEWLFGMLFPPAIFASFAGASAVHRLRLCLKIRPEELSRLPWELLYEPYQNYFFATRRSLPVVRILDSRVALRYALRSSLSSLKLLHIQSNPRDFSPLNLMESKEVILRALNGKAEITTLTRPTAARIRQALISDTFNILHFDGHGLFDWDRQSGTLIIEDEQGFGIPLTSSELANYLDDTTIRFAILAACETGVRSKQQFTGVAETLMRSTSLEAVAAMQYAISDTSAIAFIENFYENFVKEYGIGRSMTEARMGVIESAGIDSPDWATPVLLMR